MAEETVRIAVVGAGSIGQAHIQRILANPEAKLAAIIGPSPHVRELAERLNVAYFVELEEGLREARPDGLVIATPNQLHVANGLSAVTAGIPMLLEKPISDDVESAQRLVEAAEAAGVPILVGHHRRHSPLIKRAKEIVESGTLGAITAITGLSLFRKPASYFEEPYEWRREPGGGVLLINLTHVIDDLRNLCGDVVCVQAAGSNATRGFAVDDTAAILLRFANGALGTITISDATAAPWSWEMTSGENKVYPTTDEFCYLIAGTAGSLTVPQLKLWRHEGDGWHTPLATERCVVAEEDPLMLQMRHFCAVIRCETKPLLDGRGGLSTLRATLAVKEAAETGDMVRLTERDVKRIGST